MVRPAGLQRPVSRRARAEDGTIPVRRWMIPEPFVVQRVLELSELVHPPIVTMKERDQFAQRHGWKLPTTNVDMQFRTRTADLADVSESGSANLLRLLHGISNGLERRSNDPQPRHRRGLTI